MEIDCRFTSLVVGEALNGALSSEPKAVASTWKSGVIHPPALATIPKRLLGSLSEFGLKAKGLFLFVAGPCWMMSCTTRIPP